MTETKLNWYVLYTKPRQEFKAALQIESINVEHYLPTVTRMKQWSDRKKKITEPIFKGYIFIHGSEKDRLNVLEQDSVVRTICFQGKPAIVPEWQIDNMIKLLECEPEVFVSDQLVEGTRVLVTSGPLEGIEGIITYSQKDRTLAISIETLHRSIIVTLPASSVTKKVES